LQKLALTIHSIERLNEWSGRIVGYLVLPMMGVLLYEITSRYVFHSPTIWAHETSQLLYGSYCMLVGAYALLYGAHVKMDLFYARWSRRTQAIVDSFTALLTFFWLTIFLWQASENAWVALLLQETSPSAWAPPVWIYKLSFPIAVLLLLLQAIAQFSRNVVVALHGKDLLA